MTISISLSLFATGCIIKRFIVLYGLCHKIDFSNWAVLNASALTTGQVKTKNSSLKRLSLKSIVNGVK